MSPPDDLRLQRVMLETIEATAPVVGFIWNLVDNTIEWSVSAESARAWSIGRMDGQALLDGVHPDEQTDLRRRLREAFRNPGRPVDLSHTRHHPALGWRRVRSTAKSVPDDTGRPVRLVGAWVDIHQEQAHREQLERHARSDDLTGLLNRLGMIEALDATLENSRPADGGALLLVDLDRFRKLNRALGPQTGDALLCMVAETIGEAVPGGAVLARIGADQFAVLLPKTVGPETADTLAETLVHTLSAPVQVGEHEVALGVSIGVLRFGEHSSDSATAMRNAENALARAKDTGGCWAPFVPTQVPDASTISMEARLHHAIEQNAFELYYQPIVQLPTREVVSFEALIRWNDPELGWVSPGRFIPVAEESGLILPIGNWVLEEACRTLHQWRQRPEAEHIRMNINLSAIQFRQRDLVERLDTLLNAYPRARGFVNLELTETALLESPADQVEVLERLRALGCQLHIDDFGTGWSSMSNLVRLPVDALKVDREFVMRAEVDRKSLAVVRMVAQMAAEMGLSLTAEGVETEGQVHLLNALGKCRGQGYLFARPLPRDDAFDTLLQAMTIQLPRTVYREAG